jgi:hypothetical protein
MVAQWRASLIDRILEDAWVKRQLRTIENPQILQSIPFDPNSYRRGVAKIAHELAAIWLGDDYVNNDSMAATLRDFTLGEPDSIKLHGSISVGPSTIDCLQPWAVDRDCHVAVSSWVADNFLIALKIFDVIEAELVASAEPARYLTGQLDPEHIRFLHLNPVTKEVRNTSLVDEVGRLVQQSTR